MAVGSLITMGVLGCFSFMSGYFLKKYQFEAMDDVIVFAKKRLSRFYVLLFLSSSSLYLGGLVIGQNFYTTTQYLSIITGLGCFVNPAPATLWYFSMIMFFYIITPLIQRFKNKGIKVLVLCILLLTLVFLKNFVLTYVDNRLFVYLPIYFLGLLCPHSIIEHLKRWPTLFLIVPIVLFFQMRSSLLILYDLMGSFLVTCIIIFISDKLSYITKSRLLFTNISYSSMCAYLFHRHFYLFSVFLYNIHRSISLREATIPILVAVACVIAIFVMSFYIQNIFDYFQKHISRV